jgi:hypothetical protein
MREFDERTRVDREAELMARLASLRAAGADLDAAALDREVLAAVPFPPKIQIQTTTRCNAACGMCPYPVVTGEAGFAHEEMSLARYEAILAQLAGRPVERLSLFLMNEPLVDKRLPDWIGRARAALPEATLGLFTNGSALTGGVAWRLAAAGLGELSVSVHGFDRETYEAVMAGLSFARLERNLREVFELRAAGDLGSLRIQLVTGDVPDIRASLDRAPPALREHALLKAFSNERALVGADMPVPSSLKRPRAAALSPLCHRPFVKLYVLASGQCVLCNCDWRRTVVLGRVGERPDDATVEAVWQGARYRDVRHQLFTGRHARGLLCTGCDYAEVVGDD